MFSNAPISKIEKESFRKDIQILRGLAVTSVMFFHFNSKLFENGYIGVDIFFVISGFLISNIIYSEITNNKFKLKNFFDLEMHKPLSFIYVEGTTKISSYSSVFSFATDPFIWFSFSKDRE